VWVSLGGGICVLCQANSLCTMEWRHVFSVLQASASRPSLLPSFGSAVSADRGTLPMLLVHVDYRPCASFANTSLITSECRGRQWEIHLQLRRSERQDRDAPLKNFTPKQQYLNTSACVLIYADMVNKAHGGSGPFFPAVTGLAVLQVCPVRSHS